jgi:hypothetical protein
MMTTLFNHRGRAARAAAVGLVALAAALFQAREARGQWSQPDSAGNVNSTNTGNIGIGTTTAASKLDISGTSGVTVRTGGASAGFSVFDRPSVPGDQIVFQGNAGNYSMLNMATRNANFGSEKLSGFSMWTVDNAYTPNATQFQIQNSPTFGGVIFTQKFGTGAQGDKKVSFQTAWNQQSVPTQFVLDTTGNVGIGTATPGVVNGMTALAPYMPLHIQGQGTNPASVVVNSASPYSGFVINDGSQPADSRMWSISQAAGGGRLTFRTYADSGGAASDKVVIDRSGNVGVGTTAPVGILDGQRAEASDLLMRLWNTSATGGTATLRIANSSNEGSRIQLTDSNSYVSTIAADRVGGLRFRTGNASSEAALADRVAITPGGNVGIGINNPTTKLHVVGDITVTGNINAKYQDVAEWVPSTQKLAAGTVVVLDTGRDNHVLASKGSYDTRVAGVISAQPGLSLGEKGEGKVLVATTGRVKVKVDADRAPIKIGDLIVTSDVEGVAMKSVPVELGGIAIHRPGTLIGKALESLEKGTGEILVLLSLQ